MIPATRQYPYTVGPPADLYQGRGVYHFEHERDARWFFDNLGKHRRDWVLGKRNPNHDPTKQASPENPKLITMDPA